jgi:hypothetical protein
VVVAVLLVGIGGVAVDRAVAASKAESRSNDLAGRDRLRVAEIRRLERATGKASSSARNARVASAASLAQTAALRAGLDLLVGSSRAAVDELRREVADRDAQLAALRVASSSTTSTSLDLGAQVYRAVQCFYAILGTPLGHTPECPSP